MSINILKQTPRELGYYFPAEWAHHSATWLSWPHKEDSWPGKLETVYPVYAQFVKEVAQGEQVCINVNDATMEAQAKKCLETAGVPMNKVSFFLHPTNDAWCRDHGPAFLVNSKEDKERVLVKWNYNAWGEKYPPHDLDNQIPLHIAKHYGMSVAKPDIVMEGGSVEFNGEGTIMTTTACLLNPNRNPHLSKEQIEQYLMDYYGASQVLWIGDGIVGDDTDGHIDDITRFVNADTVVTVIEENEEDENYQPLQENLELLQNMTLANGKPLKVVTLPMPKPVIYEDQRLPASYANFYIANAAVIVPTYRDTENDRKALDILATCFPDRKVVGLDSTDIVWGLGSFHCLSQQEPSGKRD